MNVKKKKKNYRASSISDWKEYYHSRNVQGYQSLVDVDDFRNLSRRILIDTIGIYIKGKNHVIEIGAGDSDILIDIARRFRPKEIYGLDYLEEACIRLSDKAKQVEVDIVVCCADMFSPPTCLLNKFDFVMSFGVVEHFTDLAGTLKAISKFARDGALIFTLIPNNKKTIYGWLMRHWNREVYNAHVLYDINEFKEAHADAGLEIIFCDYLVSSNFSVLSWCFKNNRKGINYWIYRQLTRVSKLIWLVESKIGLLRPGRLLSPYVVCVSARK